MKSLGLILIIIVLASIYGFVAKNLFINNPSEKKIFIIILIAMFIVFLLLVISSLFR